MNKKELIITIVILSMALMTVFSVAVNLFRSSKYEHTHEKLDWSIQDIDNNSIAEFDENGKLTGGLFLRMQNDLNDLYYNNPE